MYVYRCSIDLSYVDELSKRQTAVACSCVKKKICLFCQQVIKTFFSFMPFVGENAGIKTFKSYH